MSSSRYSTSGATPDVWKVGNLRHLANRNRLWPAIFLVAALPRILGAFFLPNAFGDAYVYIRDLGAMSTRMRAGTFALTDVYGFWLPLYQFIAALINVVVGNPFYSGKLVSALFGVGVCLLIYSVTLRLTAHRTAALLAFLLIALNPLHIHYSASAMTDVPHAFFVLASLYFCVQERWTLAAICAALAGLTRMESWMFIAFIPAIQFCKQRRIPLVTIAILMIPPVFWLYISWKATGDWLACFVARRQYHDWLFAANPTIAHFSLPHILQDGATLLVSADIAVLTAAFVAAWLIAKPLTQRRRIPDEEQEIFPALVFFFAFLCMIIGTYLTGWQPIVFPRYGLILFTLGIPTLAWTLLRLRKQRPRWARRLLIAVVAICVIDASVQLIGTVGLLNQISAERAIADYLRVHDQPNAHIFCDDTTVQALSGIPLEKFLTSADAPRDREGFLKYVKEKSVGYLVLSNQDPTATTRALADLKSAEGDETFRPVLNARTGFLRTDIRVYLVHNAGP